MCGWNPGNVTTDQNIGAMVDEIKESREFSKEISCDLRGNNNSTLGVALGRGAYS